jgi:PPOX class probable F420-dependent enzyme
MTATNSANFSNGWPIHGVSDLTGSASLISQLKRLPGLADYHEQGSTEGVTRVSRAIRTATTPSRPACSGHPHRSKHEVAAWHVAHATSAPTEAVGNMIQASEGRSLLRSGETDWEPAAARREDAVNPRRIDGREMQRLDGRLAQTIEWIGGRDSRATQVVGVQQILGSRRHKLAMSDEDVEEFLEQHWLASVATIGKGGQPHLVNVGYGISDGSLLFTTYRSAQKAVNLIRDPRLTCLIEDIGDGYGDIRGVQIVGHAEILESNDEVRRVIELGMSQVTQGWHGPRNAIDPSEIAGKRIAVRVRADRVISWYHRTLNGKY